MDVLTWAAAQAIAAIALNKFVEGGAGKLGKHLSEAVVAKIKALGALVWERIKGKPEIVAVLPAVEQQQPAAIAQLQAGLEELWRDEQSEFTQQVKQLALEIDQAITIEQMSGGEVWNVSGGKAQKNVFTDNKAPILKDVNNSTINISYGTPPN